MSSARRMDRLAVAVTIMLAWALVGSASAQTRLDVYSDDFSGGSMAPPSSAVRDTRIDMDIPRLQAIEAGVAALRTELGNHPHPDHAHDPHVHFTQATGWASESSGGGGSDGIILYVVGGQQGDWDYGVTHQTDYVGDDGLVTLTNGTTYTTNWEDSDGYAQGVEEHGTDGRLPWDFWFDYTDTPIH